VAIVALLLLQLLLELLFKTQQSAACRKEMSREVNEGSGGMVRR